MGQVTGKEGTLCGGHDTLEDQPGAGACSEGVEGLACQAIDAELKVAGPTVGHEQASNPEDSVLALFDLPTEILVDVVLLEFAGDPRTLCRLEAVSKGVNLALKSHQGALWAPNLLRDFNETCDDPRRRYKELYISFGRYLPLYSTMDRAVNSICEFHAQAGLSRFTRQPGVSELTLDALSAKLNAPLPEDLRLLYRLIGPTKLDDLQMPDEGGYGAPGMFGGVSVYDYRLNIALFDSSFMPAGETAWLVHFGICVDDGSLLSCIVNAESPENKMGWPRGTVLLGHVNGRTWFKWADSVQALMARYHENITTGTWAQHHGGIPMLSWFSTSPRSDTTTHNVRVRVSPVFLHRISDHHTWSFAYEVTLNLADGATEDDACQLVSRHWACTPANGVTDHVRGDGVIGLYPTLRPGEEAFKYASMTRFPTSRERVAGTMAGEFTMRNLKTGNCFDVVIGTTEFLSPTTPEEMAMRSRMCPYSQS